MLRAVLAVLFLLQLCVLSLHAGSSLIHLLVLSRRITISAWERFAAREMGKIAVILTNTSAF